MDELEKRLRDDAVRIDAVASRDLQRRIDASLAAEQEVRRVRAERPASHGSMWWISSLTGLAAALAVILIMNWNRPAGESTEDQFADVPSATPAPSDDWGIAPGIDWDVRSANVTSPLEEELLNLQSDLEKARRSVERDVGLSF